MNRRGFLGRLGAAVLAAPVALVASPVATQAQGAVRPGGTGGTLRLGDGARLTDTTILDGTLVVIDGDGAVFANNVMRGGGISIAPTARNYAITNNMFFGARS